MKLIGRYEVRGLLGRGGMARVFKVRAPVLGRLAALKLFAPREELVALAGEGALLRRFQDEARALARLDHPNLVAVWDYGQHEGRPFYVMDYLCRSLAGVIGEGPDVEAPTRVLTVEEALDYTRQALAGLERLHAAGLVHRDLKPANLLLTAQDQVRITDLGLARRRPGQGSDAPQAEGPANLMLGSPFYAAPEQEADPQTAGSRADLYSLGVTLLRLLTGRVALAAGQRPSALNPALDGAWDELLAKATAADPAARFGGAAEMDQALGGLEALWRGGHTQACRLGRDSAAPAPGPVRATPVKLAPRQAADAWGLDPLGHPRRWPRGELEPAGPGVVRDPATGLLWQAGGSRFPLTWPEAAEYCAGLNGGGGDDPAGEPSGPPLGGRTGWRLPTASELITLLRPPPADGAPCLPEGLAARQRWLWSADRASFTAAWFVDMDRGFVSWQDFSCTFYARAVCAG